MFADGVTPLQMLGLVGAGTYMASYAMLTLRLITPDSTSYFLLNLLASGMVLVSLTQAFNAASVAIQLFWIVVSLYGLTDRARSRAGRVCRRLPRVTADRLRPIGPHAGVVGATRTR